MLTGGTYSDALLSTSAEEETEPEETTEAPTESEADTPAETDTEAPVVRDPAEGSLSRVSFGTAVKGGWLVFLISDVLLAALIICILIKNKKGSAV